MATSKWCIVIGASAGGVETISEVVAGLPADLPAPVFVVLHLPPYCSSELPQILSAAGPLKAVHPRDGDQIENGMIYVALPDHHLLIDGNRIAVKRGPKENRFRPSIDALFRSAAYTYGAGAIGIVLSGALDDGTSGLWSIDRLGGVSIVETPEQARFDAMPRSALENVNVNHQMASQKIGAFVGKFIADNLPRTQLETLANLKDRIHTEVRIAAEAGALQKGVMQMGVSTPFTCPECKGVLVKIVEGKTARFRCHTGHGYSDNALLQAVTESVGDVLWQVIRSLEEGALLLKDMGDHLTGAGDNDQAKILFAKAEIFEKRSATFHQDVLDHETLSRDNLTPQK